MMNEGLRGQALTVSHEELGWNKMKLGESLNNKRRIVRLLNAQEREILPAKIGLCNRRLSHEVVYSKRPGNGKLDSSQANKGRSFMTINRDTPSPTAYNPRPNPPNMTTPPSYTIRPRTYPEKDGGDRVAWGKEWYTNCDRWTLRAHFNSEHTWPSPTDHVPKTTIGSPQSVLHQSPSHSMQGRREFTLVGKDALVFPGPCAYDRSRSQNKALATSPRISIQEGRRNGTFPVIADASSPGPGWYNPNVYKTSQKVRRPAFTISKSPRVMGLTRNCTF